MKQLTLLLLLSLLAVGCKGDSEVSQQSQSSPASQTTGQKTTEPATESIGQQPEKATTQTNSQPVFVRVKGTDGKLTERPSLLITTKAIQRLYSTASTESKSIYVGCFNVFHHLKTTNGKTEENGFYRVGDSKGNTLGWLKTNDVTHWNIPFVAVPRSRDPHGLKVYDIKDPSRVILRITSDYMRDLRRRRDDFMDWAEHRAFPLSLLVAEHYGDAAKTISFPASTLSNLIPPSMIWRLHHRRAPLSDCLIDYHDPFPRIPFGESRLFVLEAEGRENVQERMTVLFPSLAKDGSVIVVYGKIWRWDPETGRTNVSMELLVSQEVLRDLEKLLDRLIFTFRDKGGLDDRMDIKSLVKTLQPFAGKTISGKQFQVLPESQLRQFITNLPPSRTEALDLSLIELTRLPKEDFDVWLDELERAKTRCATVLAHAQWEVLSSVAREDWFSFIRLSELP